MAALSLRAHCAPSNVIPLPGALAQPPMAWSREAICDQIEALIAMLDMIDGDPDHEDGDEDCCAAHDDTPCNDTVHVMRWLPGEDEDAEEDLPEPAQVETVMLATFQKAC